jgi:hypothetical protein
MFLANVFAWERQASAWLLLRADQTVGGPGISSRLQRIFPRGKKLETFIARFALQIRLFDIRSSIENCIFTQKVARAARLC